MNNMNLLFKVNKQTIERLDNNILVENSLDFTYLKVIFSDEWLGMKKYVIFNHLISNEPTKLELDGDTIKIPNEYIAFPSFIISFEGTNDDGVKITTQSRIINVELGNVDFTQPLLP